MVRQADARNKAKRQEEMKKKQAKIKEAQDKAIADATSKLQSKAKTTTQTALKAKQSPIISPDSETRRKRSQSIDLADVRASPVARPWNDPDWLSSNLGTTGTPIRGNEESKRDPPALPPPTNLDMGGGGARPKTRSQAASEVSPASTKGEEKSQDPSPIKAKALVNNYVKDLMKGNKIQVIEEGQPIEKEITSVEQLKGSRDEIPKPLRDSLKKHFDKDFKSTSSLNSVYNWYHKLGAAVMTTTFEGDDS